jgi:hypothetical protein
MDPGQAERIFMACDKVNICKNYIYRTRAGRGGEGEGEGWGGGRKLVCSIEESNLGIEINDAQFETQRSTEAEFISLRFLCIILGVLRLEVSIYNFNIANQFQTNFAQGGGGQ